jgi:hypothetical protein
MVKCVLIKERFGVIEEIETPLESDMYHILKGPATFIGHYEELDVVVLKCRDSFIELSQNQNRLPPPFEEEFVLGPMLLVRMNQDSEPEDFTLEEFTRYFS